MSRSAKCKVFAHLISSGLLTQASSVLAMTDKSRLLDVQELEVRRLC